MHKKVYKLLFYYEKATHLSMKNPEKSLKMSTSDSKNNLILPHWLNKTEKNATKLTIRRLYVFIMVSIASS